MTKEKMIGIPIPENMKPCPCEHFWVPKWVYEYIVRKECGIKSWQKRIFSCF